MNNQQKNRILKGEQNFKLYVIPAIKQSFPGTWISTNGLDVDFESGIDWVYIDHGVPYTVASRVWESSPKQHFSIRWKRTGNIDQQLEVESRLKDMRQGKQLPVWTIEAFVFKGWVYVAIIDSLILWKVVREHLDELSDFWVMNESDQTIFKRVPFDRLEGVKKFTFLS